jgi:predicted alpha/beta-fold hydrolase
MTNPKDNAVAPSRTTVRIPTASGNELEAWLYLPQGDGPHPAVVMAHGFAGVKAGGLVPFAERFCREGFTAVAFDYRHWGGSSGQPRELTSVTRECEDYRTVIDWAASHPDIDAKRIFIWGTSFSGMHVVEIAATDGRLRGAIAQCPLVDGLAGTTNVPLIRLLRLFAVSLLDRLGSLAGRPPIYIPASAAAGEFGAIASQDAIAGLPLITPPEGTDWHNRVAARSMLGSACTDR